MKRVGTDAQTRRSPFRWWKNVSQRWFFYTAPPAPSQDALLRERTQARRGRLTSVITLGLLTLSLIALPIGLLIGDRTLTFGSLLSFFLYLVSLLLFNRFGRIYWAGALILMSFNLLVIPSLLFPSDGLSLADSPNFDLLSISLLIAVAMLPARSVWVMALVNSIFIGLDVLVVPHGGDLGQAIAFAGPGIVSRPMLLEVVVAVVVFVFVRSQEKAIVEADRSKEIAKLQQQLLTQKQEVEEQNRRLQASIAPIIETHRRVANGDFSARVPYDTQSVLWQIAGSLNNLVARAQRLRQEVAYAQALQTEYYKIQAEVARFLSLFRSARVMAHRKPFVVETVPGGTVIDAISYELRSVALLARTEVPQERVTPMPVTREQKGV